VKKKCFLVLLCAALILFSGCGNTAQEEQMKKITVGEVTHSILTPPKR